MCGVCVHQIQPHSFLTRTFSLQREPLFSSKIIFHFSTTSDSSNFLSLQCLPSCLFPFVSIYGRRLPSLVFCFNLSINTFQWQLEKSEEEENTNICECLMECKHFWALNKSTINNNNGDDS